jgi:hypothetical protein
MRALRILLLVAGVVVHMACARPAQHARTARREVPVWPAMHDYRNWLALTTEPLFSRTHGARGRFVRVYVNDIGAPAARAHRGPFPPGTIAIKELFTVEGGHRARMPDVFTAMLKRAPGTAPETGDWEWLTLDRVGHVIARGTDRSECSNCHAQAETGDFVFADTGPGDPLPNPH